MKILIILLSIISLNSILNSQVYEQKKYKWEKLGLIDGSRDTSIYLYSKVLENSNGTIFVGGVNTTPYNKRSIIASTDRGKSWQTIHYNPNTLLNIFKNLNDEILIIGDNDYCDSPFYSIIVRVEPNFLKKDTFLIKTQTTGLKMTRLLQINNKEYLIKANNGGTNFLLHWNIGDSIATQIIPIINGQDSIKQEANKHLSNFRDFYYDTKTNTIFVVNYFLDIYYSSNLFKDFKIRKDTTGNAYKYIINSVNIENTDGIYYYKRNNYNDTNINKNLNIELIKTNVISNYDSIILKNYTPYEKFIYPISLTASINNKFIVANLGVRNFVDTLDKDSLLLSDDFGKSFYYINYPIQSVEYNYYAFSTASIDSSGNILLFVPLSKDSISQSPSIFRSELYYGTPQPGDIKTNLQIISTNLLFPNPATSTTKIKLTEELNGKISAVDLLGNETPLWSGFAPVGDLELDVSHLPIGIYTILINNGYKTEALKMIKE